MLAFVLTLPIVVARLHVADPIFAVPSSLWEYLAVITCRPPRWQNPNTWTPRELAINGLHAAVCILGAPAATLHIDGSVFTPEYGTLSAPAPQP